VKKKYSLKSKMTTVVVKLTSESLINVPLPAGDQFFDFKVCGHKFSIPLSKISFLAPILAEFFVSTQKCFEILIDDNDRENSLFKGIDDSLIVESFGMLISILNGFSPSISQSSYKGLLFLGTKLGCLDLLKSLNDFQRLNFTEFAFEPSLFSFGNFDFAFNIGYETFKCSTYSAFILSRTAQHLYNDENISSLFLKIPPKFARREHKFVDHFSAFFGLIFGQSIVIDANSFEAFFEISKQLENDIVLNTVSKFMLSQNFDHLSEKLNILSQIDIPKDLQNSTIDSLLDDISEHFEEISFEALCKILPNSLFKILKSAKLKIENENTKFDFVLGCLSLHNPRPMFLFESIDFSQISQSNIKQFFDFVQFSDLNETLFNSLKGIILDCRQQKSDRVESAAPISDYVEGDAKFSEGLKYYLGRDAPQDYQKAFNCFQFCVSKQLQDVIPFLNSLSQRGIDVFQNYRHLLNSSDNPNEDLDGDLLTYLGILHLWGIAVPQNYSKALRYFESGHAKGSHESTRLIGLCYHYGYSVGQNFETALKYYQQSYSNGNAAAALDLSYLYRKGKFVEENPKKAFALAMEAVSKGSVRALYYIGYYYRHGHGVEQNYSESLKYYAKAMERGNPQAIQETAEMYHKGEGVTKDDAVGTFYDNLYKERFG
jgi:TPR repeat protein